MADVARLQLSLFGSPLLRWRGERVRVPTRKALALLCYLAVTDAAASRERLCELLDIGRAGLRQELYRLRGLAGAEDWLRVGERVSVCAESDLARFADAVARRDFGGALALWNGSPPPFDDLRVRDAPALEDWLEVERARLEALVCDAMRGRVASLEAEGETEETLVLLRRLLTFDPLDESAHRSVMRLEFGRGDLGAALAQFERCRRHLAEDLGVEAMPETLELAHAIERAVLCPPPRLGASVKRRIPPELLRPPLLVGRAREWGLMEEAWQAGVPILLSGPPGSGKTRLMTDFARSKGRYLLTGGRLGDAAVPFSSLARTLEQYLDAFADTGFDPWVEGELARLLPGRFDERPGPIASDDARLRFVGAVGAFFNAASRRLDMMLSDDMQFFDASSFEVVAHLSVALTEGGLEAGMGRPMGAFRSGELPADYQRWLREAAARGAIAHVAVEPLSIAAVAELLRSVGVAEARALDPRLHRFTGGNPQFIVELLKTLFARGEFGAFPTNLAEVGVPKRVGQTIKRRLEGLSKGALRLAQTLAAWQVPVGGEALARVLGLSAFEAAEGLAELHEAQLLAENASCESGFVHDLLLETVRRGTPRAVARLLHRKIAGELEAQEAEPARVARHWLEAGERPRALPWLLRAARLALAQGSPQEAVGWLKEVAEAAEEESNLKAEALLQLGVASLAADLGAAERYLQRALETSRRGQHHASAVWSLAHLASAATSRGERAQAEKRMAEALELAPSALSESEQARLHFMASQVRWGFGDFSGTEAAIMAALEREPGARAYQLSLAELRWHQGRFHSGVAELTTLLARDPAAARLTMLYHDLAVSYWMLSELGEAERWMRESLAVWADSGDLYREAMSLMGMAMVKGSLGRYAQAETDLAAAGERFRILGATPRWADTLVRRAALRFNLGRYPEAGSLCQKGLAVLRPTDNPYLLSYALTLQAGCLMRQGDEAGHACASEALEQAARTAQPLALTLALRAAAESALMRGDQSAGRAHAGRAAALARRHEMAEQLGYALLYEAAASAGEAAKAALETALELGVSRKLPHLVWLAAADLSRAVGDACRRDARQAQAQAARRTLLEQAPAEWSGPGDGQLF